MGSIDIETETCLRVIATKCYENEETGLISISGWKGLQSEETPILITVLDEISQSKWTRFVEHSSSKRNTLKVKVPRSAVHNQIVVTAQLLLENKSCAKDKTGSRRFTVESTSTCLATAAPRDEIDIEGMMGIGLNMSTSKEKTGLPKDISLEIELRSTDLARLRLKKTSKGVVMRWLITIEEMGAIDQKDVFLLPADEDTTDFEFRIEDGKEYHIEAVELDRTGGNILCQGSINYTAGLPATMFLEIERRYAELAELHMRKSWRGVVIWVITIEEVEASDKKGVFFLPGDKDTTDFEFGIEDGKEYHIEAIGQDCKGGNIFCHGSTNYRGPQTVPYTVEELRQLHQMAVAHAGQSSAPCIWLYRNKKPEYFHKILQKYHGNMEPYIKDNSGDPRSPINGRRDGLFFMASVKKGEPLPDSAFGTARVLFPAEELLAKAPNLYFTDFYCMSGKSHYVTLVMTRPGSMSDQFCATRLLPLNLRDRSSNPFLFFDQSSHQLRVSTKKKLFVELFFTENIDISGCEIKKTPITKNCRGFSKDGGKPKNPKCRVCNLRNSN